MPLSIVWQPGPRRLNTESWQGVLTEKPARKPCKKQEKWWLSMPWSQFWLLRCALAADWRCSKGAEEQRWRTKLPTVTCKATCTIICLWNTSTKKKVQLEENHERHQLPNEFLWGSKVTGLLRQLWGFADNYRGAARLATSIALNPPWNLSVFLPPVQRWHWSPRSIWRGLSLCARRLVALLGPLGLQCRGTAKSLPAKTYTAKHAAKHNRQHLCRWKRKQVSSALFFFEPSWILRQNMCNPPRDADVSNVIIAIPTFTQQNAGIPTSQKHPRLASSQTQLTVSAKATSWAIMDTIKISCSNFSGKLTLYVCVGLYIQFLLIVCCIFSLDVIGMNLRLWNYEGLTPVICNSWCFSFIKYFSQFFSL